MKQIINNAFIKSYAFKSFQEYSMFIENQNIKTILTLNDTFGDNFICYVFCDSLTQEKLFIVTFNCDEEESNLNLLFWTESQLLVIDTGRKIYLIEENLIVRCSLEIVTPLVGLYVIKNNRLLVLEEASAKIVSSGGEILKNELFDLIENFIVKDDALFINTNDGNKVFNLI